MQTSATCFRAPPSKPENPSTLPPLSCTYLAAFKRFWDQTPALSAPEPPCTLRTTRMSPLFMRFLSCSRYTLSQPKSLVKAETRGMLSFRQMARNRGLPSTLVNLDRSQVKWVALEAEPPLPAMKICLPSFQAVNRRFKAAFMSAWETRLVTDSSSSRYSLTKFSVFMFFHLSVEGDFGAVRFETKSDFA